MEHRGLTRHYGEALRILHERGHRVRVVYAYDRARKGEITFAERLMAACPGLTVKKAPEPATGRWATAASLTRLLMDCIRYFDSHFKEAHLLRERAHKNLAGWVRRPIRAVRLLGDRGVRVSIAALQRIDAAIPHSEPAMELVRNASPDLVLVAPLVNFRSPEVDYIKVANVLGIPTGCCVPSWDNLTNKGHLCAVPDRVMVWNEPQRDEAVTLHGVPRENVVITGAQLFDHWFSWEPVRDQKTFCEHVGLDPERPFVTFLGSSQWIAPRELHFVERWVRALRAAEDPTVAGIGILVRPHPTRAWRYLSMDFSQLGGNAVVWPPYNPELIHYHTDEGRTEFFESLYHASAAVGVNTSAMIEAGIVGCPTCTIRDSSVAQGQSGTLHFDLLTSTGGGLLKSSDSLEEHARELAGVIAAGRDDSARSFVESFVRPHGLDRPAAPILADAIEEAAGLTREPRKYSSLMQKALRAFLIPWTHVIHALDPFARPKRRNRSDHVTVRRMARLWIRLTYGAAGRGLLRGPATRKEGRSRKPSMARRLLARTRRLPSAARRIPAMVRELPRLADPQARAWTTFGARLGRLWAKLLISFYVLSAWAIWPAGRLRRGLARSFR